MRLHTFVRAQHPEALFRMSTTSAISTSTSSSSRPASASQSSAAGVPYALRVFLRVRPPLPREPQEDSLFVVSNPSSDGTQTVTVLPYDALNDRRRDDRRNDREKSFTFDGVFGVQSAQTEVFTRTVEPQVAACLQGFNATVFCYGPSGTGKSFTCYGPSGAAGTGGSTDAARWAASAEAGMIPRAAEQLFASIERGGALQHGRFLLRVSFLQLYRESLSDLLAPDGPSLHLREDPQRGVFVEGLTEVTVRTPQEVWALAARGQRARSTAATRLNDVSSRSHAVFAVVVEQTVAADDASDAPAATTSGAPAGITAPPSSAASSIDALEPTALKLSRLNLVDLAGSERAALMGESGDRLEESKKINLSLSALAKVPRPRPWPESCPCP